MLLLMDKPKTEVETIREISSHWEPLKLEAALGVRQEMQLPRMSPLREMQPWKTPFFTFDSLVGKIRQWHSEEQMLILFNQARINRPRWENNEGLLLLDTEMEVEGSFMGRG